MEVEGIYPLFVATKNPDLNNMKLHGFILSVAMSERNRI